MRAGSRWRYALESRGMKVGSSETEYMCVNERDPRGTVSLQGVEIKKVEDFKYLESIVQSNSKCGKRVKWHVKAGWNEWRKVSGVMSDKTFSKNGKRYTRQW